VDPQVALRPEPFGALAYHFGTRRLSFLKTRTLLAVVQALADHLTAREACATPASRSRRCLPPRERSSRSPLRA
jgi:putative mycofactocin binding protein MftB